MPILGFFEDLMTDKNKATEKGILGVLEIPTNEPEKEYPHKSASDNYRKVGIGGGVTKIEFETNQGKRRTKSPTNPYTMVTLCVASNIVLTYGASALLVYCAIAAVFRMRPNSKDPHKIPSQFKNDLNLSPKSFYRAVAILEKEGYIQVFKSRNLSTWQIKKPRKEENE